jgi:hypothetical protein
MPQVSSMTPRLINSAALSHRSQSDLHDADLSSSHVVHMTDASKCEASTSNWSAACCRVVT